MLESFLGELRPMPPQRILDFDVETVAAGFADPNWVPQKITCVAWSWVGENTVYNRICGPEGLFGNPEARAAMLRPLLQAIGQATMVTGHNLIRFDLPVINSECMRLGLSVLPNLLVQDTMRVWRSKGLKKGQDNLARMLKTQDEKESLDWQAWQDAYDQPGWPIVRSRATSDVRMHKQMREAMIARDMIKAPVTWRS